MKVSTFFLILIMYSFGTFGFLNIFGMRTIVQIIIVVGIAFLMLQNRTTYTQKNLFLVFILSLFLIFKNGNLYLIVEIFIIIFVVNLISTSTNKQLLYMSKALVITTSFLCALLLIVFVYYKINPDDFNNANFRIYDSTVGHQKIYPGNFMDFLSFTSGDGFLFNGTPTFRLKGYSNEPSSTVVHYLAPAVIALCLGGRYIYLGLFIIFVNITTIASFISYLILAFSLLFFILIKLTRNYFKYILLLCCFIVLFLSSDAAIIESVFIYTGDLAIDYLNFDLISRKVGENNLTLRQNGWIQGLYLMLYSPWGYSQEELGPGAGLMYLISSDLGWLGIFVFAFLLSKMLNNCEYLIQSKNYRSTVYCVSFLFSIVFITSFFSGYGWSRPPGVIMLCMFFRVFQSSFIDSLRDDVNLRKH